VTFRAYLTAMNVALRERAAGVAVSFDARRHVWTLGDREIRAAEIDAKAVRFQLYTKGPRERLVGSYSGTIGATPDEVVAYLVYFLETGKAWHQNLAKGGLP
jgi:hypothetical protein